MFSPPYYRARWFGLTALLLGLLGQALLSLFILLNGLDLWPHQAPSDGSFPWLVNGVLLLIFALQHSGMARAFYKERVGCFFPDFVERPLYVACSGMAV